MYVRGCIDERLEQEWTSQQHVGWHGSARPGPACGEAPGCGGPAGGAPPRSASPGAPGFGQTCAAAPPTPVRGRVATGGGSRKGSPFLHENLSCGNLCTRPRLVFHLGVAFGQKKNKTPTPKVLMLQRTLAAAIPQVPPVLSKIPSGNHLLGKMSKLLPKLPQNAKALAKSMASCIPLLALSRRGSQSNQLLAQSKPPGL